VLRKRSRGQCKFSIAVRRAYDLGISEKLGGDYQYSVVLSVTHLSKSWMGDPQAVDFIDRTEEMPGRVALRQPLLLH